MKSLLLGSMIGLASAPILAAQTDARPNIVLIVTDDLGFADVGTRPGGPRTPNIARLAREGLTFTSFYANGATCTPTRAALVSGRYQQRFALEHPLAFHGRIDFQRGLPVTGHSLPALLRSNGYRTALIGKWHLGWAPEFSPNAHGFEYFYGFKSAYVDYYQHTGGGIMAGQHDFWENERVVHDTGYVTDLINRRAVRYIGENARQPFFLEISHAAPHWPYQRPGHPTVSRDSARHLTPFDSATSTRADYVAMVESVDAAVGDVLAAIERAGIARNTIVVFTNDNGGEWLGDNSPWFHYKGTVWEGGIRVPAFIRWPARIRPGRTSNQVAMTMDLTHTFLAVTGTPVPEAARLDGIDLTPVLTGAAESIERMAFWRVVEPPRTQRAVRSGRWKLLVDEDRPMLFDIDSDPGERNNVIRDNATVAIRLRTALQRWNAAVDGEARATANAVVDARSRLGAAFFALTVSNVDTLARWYRENLGFAIERAPEAASNGRRGALLIRDGARIEMLEFGSARARDAYGIPAVEQVHGIMKIGFTVPDLEWQFARARERGLSIFFPITRPPGASFRTFAVRDPDGNIVQLFGQ